MSPKLLPTCDRVCAVCCGDSLAGEGMSAVQKEVCDSFVYIPQFTGRWLHLPGVKYQGNTIYFSGQAGYDKSSRVARRRPQYF